MGDQEVVELTFETSARRDIFVQELEKILKQRGGGVIKLLYGATAVIMPRLITGRGTYYSRGGIIHSI